MSDTARYPENTETTMYFINGLFHLDEALQAAREKWGRNLEFDDITLGAEHIQIDHFRYDLYDSGDWANYVTFTYRR